MSDNSASSRESSPGRFRSRSPDEESVPPSTWQNTSSSALHPSSSQTPSFASTSLLRQPVGFGANPTGPATSYHPKEGPISAPSPHRYYPSHSSDVVDLPRHASVKGKEKERTKDRTKDASRKGRERDKGTSGQTIAHSHHPPPPPPPDPQKKAFRVNHYTNDPSAGGSPYTVQDGPYGAAYRANVGERVSSGHSQPSSTSTRHRHRQSGESTQRVQDPHPRPSYYRYQTDYDRIRESAPANHTKQAATAATAIPTPQSTPHSSATSHHPYHPTPSASSSYPPSDTQHHHRDSRSHKRKDTRMYPADTPYPNSNYYFGDTQDPFVTDHFDPTHLSPSHFEQFTPAHSPRLAPAPAPAPAPVPVPAPPPREKRHKSRPHRYEQSQQASPAPSALPQPPQHQPQPQPQRQPQPEAPIRTCRVLTLLIEDKRNGDGESMLTEVRVPLRPMDGGEAGFWADAQEVTEELQKGPSRIDGSAKVYTLRGKYKQYFLRISADGEQVCQSANLKVAPDRTLEIYIEDNPLPATISYAPSSSPLRHERELLTPITDSMASPSPDPMQTPAPVSGHKQGSRSSLFSVEDYPSAEELKFGSAPNTSTSSRKRTRSASIQSVQSIRSEGSQGYLQPQSHDAYSPFNRRTPSASMSNGTHSRAPSHSSPVPQPPQAPQLVESVEMSPISPVMELPTAQQPQAFPRPLQPIKTSFSFTQSPGTVASTRSVSTSTSGPSPPKKAKLSVQAHRHTEHSVSPGPSQPGSYPWSDSRSSTLSTDMSVPAQATGFAAFANPLAKSPFSSTSIPSSDPFARYGSGTFGIPTPQSEASTTPASQGNPALPSVTIPFVPTVPSLSSVSTATPSVMPTTMAPSAMTVTPTLSGQASSDLDNAVGKYIRAIIDKEPEWATFVENRKRVLKVSEQLAQYRYVQRIFDRFVNASTPPDLEGAGGVVITKTQVMRAFNLQPAWGEQCTETLVLTSLYGPGGTRCEDPRVVKMMDEPPAITTKITVDRYLGVLREVHGQWTVNNPG